MKTPKRWSLYSVRKVQGKQSLHGFHIKLLSTLGTGSPGKNCAPITTDCLWSSLAFLLQCKHRSILGTGFLTVGLGANTSPRLDGVTRVSGMSRREFLCYTSSPDSTASSGRLMAHFPLCFSCMIFAEMRKGGGTRQARFSFGGF